jgi:hypothetical protein
MGGCKKCEVPSSLAHVSGKVGRFYLIAKGGDKSQLEACDNPPEMDLMESQGHASNVCACKEDKQ